MFSPLAISLACSLKIKLENLGFNKSLDATAGAANIAAAGAIPPRTPAAPAAPPKDNNVPAAPACFN